MLQVIALVIAALLFLTMLIAVATSNSPFASWVNNKLGKYFTKKGDEI